MGFHFKLAFLPSSWSISCADESESEEGTKVETKEEEELGFYGVGWRWEGYWH